MQTTQRIGKEKKNNIILPASERRALRPCAPSLGPSSPFGPSVLPVQSAHPVRPVRPSVQQTSGLGKHAKDNHTMMSDECHMVNERMWSHTSQTEPVEHVHAMYVWVRV